ncbi:MAG: helix-turn-helix domain-containing protein [Acutalibacteraceae bacterium]
MINHNLRLLRKKKGFTQEQVASKIGVSRQAVARWESGETVPDVSNCGALAKLYEISLDELVNYDNCNQGDGIAPKGKYIFGTVTVNERGQIVIPKKAREIFKINPGDDLIILGDDSRGIALIKADDLRFILQNAMEGE